jgi:hypothetical protein
MWHGNDAGLALAGFLHRNLRPNNSKGLALQKSDANRRAHNPNDAIDP